MCAATLDPGDEILFAWPSFEMYPILALHMGATVVRVPLVDHRHDLDAMARAVTHRTRLVFVCNPNNPTSTAVDRRALDAFLAAVRDDCLVVLDEAYFEFVTDPDVPDGLDLLAAHDNVVVLRTFSKAYGLAALRVGYAIGYPDVIAVLRKVAMPFRVNALAQVAALASLGEDAQAEMRARVAEVCTERDRLTDVLAALGLSVPRSEANFVWLDRPDDAVRLGRVLGTARSRAASLRRCRRAGDDRHARRERTLPRRDARVHGRSLTHSLTSSPMPSMAVRTTCPPRR